MKRMLALAACSALVVAVGAAPMVAAQGAVAHPAHVHAGACPAPGDVMAPLTDLVAVARDASGTGVASSVTSVPLALSDIVVGEHAIVVHHSADDMGTYIACGDLGGVVVDGQLAVVLGALNDSAAHGIALLVDAGDGTTTVSAYIADPSGGMLASTVPVTLADFAVTAGTDAIKVGQPVTFAIANEGPSIHELVLEKAGDVDVPLEQADGSAAEVEDVEVGGSGTLTFTFMEPGTYQLACHIEGHYEAGMVTTFEVTG